MLTPITIKQPWARKSVSWPLAQSFFLASCNCTYFASFPAKPDQKPDVTTARLPINFFNLNQNCSLSYCLLCYNKLTHINQLRKQPTVTLALRYQVSRSLVQHTSLWAFTDSLSRLQSDLCGDIHWDTTPLLLKLCLKCLTCLNYIRSFFLPAKHSPVR